MPRRRRTRFIPLTQLLRLRHPALDDPVGVIVGGRVVVDGSVIANSNAMVRSNSSIRIVARRQLRGEAKLTRALDAFGLSVEGVVAVDVGAAAGGFTSTLLDRGAVRVYAVDVGFGQLVGRLRADPRVVNLERTNVASLDSTRVPELIALITMDLSYLPVADAILHIERLRLAPDARLMALVKPTFELRSGSLATGADEVRDAISIAVDAIEQSPWTVEAVTTPMVTGAGGAIEAFVLARRADRG